MLPLIFATLLLINDPKPTMEAQDICEQFVRTRIEIASFDEISALPIPQKVGEWLVEGQVKGPEGPLLFACHLDHQAERWILLNFSLWAPQPIKEV
ncbi:hypothetical protein [Aeromonas cavernicola]|uniref:SOCS box domain-containing protein n=1 Tax=Aeromonas cavernicola TaxID=1006623 RepID=A0A2H9U7J4_9GAMM|nr:hypothetical protein [Aeromonas cavernicola]PJG59949.1 hypothetical protein CUC53_04430 [Aeromonas cavernicola]